MNKSKFSYFIHMFSMLTTAILVFSSIYILFFFGLNVEIKMKYIWGVLAISLILSTAYLPLYSDLSKKAYIIGSVIYYVFADCVVLGVGLLLGWFRLEVPASIIGMEITFVVVSVSVFFIEYLSIKHSTHVLNDQLKKVHDMNATISSGKNS